MPHIHIESNSLSEIIVLASWVGLCLETKCSYGLGVVLWDLGLRVAVEDGGSIGTDESEGMFILVSTSMSLFALMMLSCIQFLAHSNKGFAMAWNSSSVTSDVMSKGQVLAVVFLATGHQNRAMIL
jgi:hypothetical protein